MIGVRVGYVVGRWVAWTALLAAGGGAGFVSARQLDARAAAGPAPGPATARVERRDLAATVLATGVIRPQVGAQVAVGSRASGVVARLHVTVGDRIQAGDLLAELDRTELETRLRQVEAVRADAASLEAYSGKELSRARQLAAIGGVTDTELSAAVRAAEAASARLREAEAAVDAARVQLDWATIRAPIGGVVATVSTQEGETVAASFAAPTFLTIVDLARLEVWAYVDETDIGRVRVGQRASFTVDSWPDQPFTGRVTAIRPTAEVRDNVVNYVTLIEITPQPDRLLRPEMTATVHIELDGRPDALSIPNGALRRDAAGSWVLVDGGPAPERRPVQTGFRGAEYTEVLSGLTEGERVITGALPVCAATPDPVEARQ